MLDLKSRRDLIAKLRDDADARGMRELALFYACEVIRVGNERITDILDRLNLQSKEKSP